MVLFLMFLDGLIHVSKCNLGLNLLYFIVLVIQRVWGKNHGILEGLEMKNKGEKSENALG